MDATWRRRTADISKFMSVDEDVILETGPDGNDHIKANSHCLRAASPFFGKLFSEAWSQGQQATPSSPRHVDMHGDDPKAMRAIVSVLHHRNETADRSFSPRRIFKIAVLADKYLLTSALRLAASF